MQAVAFVKPGQLELRDLPEAPPGAGEVTLAVAYCGVCGSDIHEYESTAISPRSAGMFQPVMGHEFAGRIVALGEGVAGFARGDAVAVHPGDPCGACEFCARGEANLCGAQMGTGYRKPGAYAERVTVRATSLVRLPEGAPLDHAALTEPFAVALHALNRAALKAGETVFIAGAGPIGLLSVLAARLGGAACVIASEPAAGRRALALRVGADEALDPREAVGRARAATAGSGADIAVECAGVTAAMDDCRAAIRRGGRMVIAGFNEGKYELDLGMTLWQEHTILGSFGYSDEFPKAAELVTSGSVDVSPIVSRVVRLDELPAVFAALAADRGSAGKVLVAPNGAR